MPTTFVVLPACGHPLGSNRSRDPCLEVSANICPDSSPPSYISSTFSSVLQHDADQTLGCIGFMSANVRNFSISAKFHAPSKSCSDARHMGSITMARAFSLFIHCIPSFLYKVIILFTLLAFKGQSLYLPNTSGFSICNTLIFSISSSAASTFTSNAITPLFFPYYLHRPLAVLPCTITNIFLISIYLWLIDLISKTRVDCAPLNSPGQCTFEQPWTVPQCSQKGFFLHNSIQNT